MTDSERIDALEQRLTRIEQILGDWTTPPLLSQGKTPAELENGRYDLKESDYQLHVAIDELKEKVLPAIRQDITDLKARPTGTSSSAPVLPLVAAPAGVIAVRETRPTSSELLTESVVDSLEIDGAEVFDKPVAFLAEVGMGGAPIASVPFCMRTGKGMSSLVRVPEAQSQEKSGDRIRAGMFYHEPYDDGMRILQGGIYANGRFYRTRDVVNILAMDSAGKVSKSTERYADGRVERGQTWAVWEDLDNPEGPMLWVQACRAGMGVGVVGSTQTMNDHNPNPNDRPVVLLEPIKQSTDIRVEDYQG